MPIGRTGSRGTPIISRESPQGRANLAQIAARGGGATAQEARSGLAELRVRDLQSAQNKLNSGQALTEEERLAVFQAGATPELKATSQGLLSQDNSIKQAQGNITAQISSRAAPAVETRGGFNANVFISNISPESTQAQKAFLSNERIAKTPTTALRAPAEPRTSAKTFAVPIAGGVNLIRESTISPPSVLQTRVANTFKIPDTGFTRDIFGGIESIRQGYRGKQVLRREINQARQRVSIESTQLEAEKARIEAEQKSNAVFLETGISAGYLARQDNQLYYTQSTTPQFKTSFESYNLQANKDIENFNKSIDKYNYNIQVANIKVPSNFQSFNSQIVNQFQKVLPEEKLKALLEVPFPTTPQKGITPLTPFISEKTNKRLQTIGMETNAAAQQLFIGPYEQPIIAGAFFAGGLVAGPVLEVAGVGSLALSTKVFGKTAGPTVAKNIALFGGLSLGAYTAFELGKGAYQAEKLQPRTGAGEYIGRELSTKLIPAGLGYQTFKGLEANYVAGRNIKTKEFLLEQQNIAPSNQIYKAGILRGELGSKTTGVADIYARDINTAAQRKEVYSFLRERFGAQETENILGNVQARQVIIKSSQGIFKTGFFTKQPENILELTIVPKTAPYTTPAFAPTFVEITTPKGVQQFGGLISGNIGEQVTLNQVINFGGALKGKIGTVKVPKFVQNVQPSRFTYVDVSGQLRQLNVKGTPKFLNENIQAIIQTQGPTSMPTKFGQINLNPSSNQQVLNDISTIFEKTGGRYYRLGITPSYSTKLTTGAQRNFPKPVKPNIESTQTFENLINKGYQKEFTGRPEALSLSNQEIYLTGKGRVEALATGKFKYPSLTQKEATRLSDYFANLPTKKQPSRFGSLRNLFNIGKKGQLASQSLISQEAEQAPIIRTANIPQQLFSLPSSKNVAPQYATAFQATIVSTKASSAFQAGSLSSLIQTNRQQQIYQPQEKVALTTFQTPKQISVARVAQTPSQRVSQTSRVAQTPFKAQLFQQTPITPLAPQNPNFPITPEFPTIPTIFKVGGGGFGFPLFSSGGGEYQPRRRRSRSREKQFYIPSLFGLAYKVKFKGQPEQFLGTKFTGLEPRGTPKSYKQPKFKLFGGGFNGKQKNNFF